jgi:hypothetical protein
VALPRRTHVGTSSCAGPLCGLQRGLAVDAPSRSNEVRCLLVAAIVRDPDIGISMLCFLVDFD